MLPYTSPPVRGATDLAAHNRNSSHYCISVLCCPVALVRALLERPAALCSEKLNCPFAESSLAQSPNSSAAQILPLIAMFDRHSSQESIGCGGRRRVEFEDAVSPLIQSSLIKVSYATQKDYQANEPLYDMHDFVQLATRYWLRKQAQVTTTRKVSLRIWLLLTLSGHQETWAGCRALLPQPRRCWTMI